MRRLQGLLPEPSPELLAYGLSTDAVLVTTVPQAEAGEQTASATAATAAPQSTGVPVGYLLAIRGPDTHLAELVVAPNVRREGRASALLSALLSRLPADERVTLAVAPDNEAAQSLYRSFGFEHVETDHTLFEAGPAFVFERA